MTVRSRVSLLLFLALLPLPAFAFTQSGVGFGIDSAIPMGHEWLTRRAFVELANGGFTDPLTGPDPNDPRLTWKNGLGLAKNTSGINASYLTFLTSVRASSNPYQAQYSIVLDAVIGERWVDLGGFNDTTSIMSGVIGPNCFLAVTQDPPEVQYDHFLRMSGDTGNAGGETALKASAARFKAALVAAAAAPPDARVLVWDGGGITSQYTVSLSAFLLGRAIHTFQDSFSLEHVVRSGADNYTTLKQVKSYVCSEGTNQHSHSTTAILSYASNDVIWLKGSRFTTSQWKSYLPSAMKIPALVALEATKDVWAAWLRISMANGSKRTTLAEGEADALVTNWLSYDPASLESWYDTPANRDSTYVATDADQKTCLGGSTLQAVLAQAQSDQNKCLYSLRPVAGYSDFTELDPSLHLWLNWEWKSTVAWATPPSGWSPSNTKPSPSPPAFGWLRNVGTGADLSVLSGKAITVNGATPVNQLFAGMSATSVYIRIAGTPGSFLQPGSNGTVVLAGPGPGAAFTITKVGTTSTFTLQHDQSKAYLWVDGNGNVLLDGKGNPGDASAQWHLVSTLGTPSA